MAAFLQLDGGREDGVTSLAFSPSGAMLASASLDGTVGVYQLRDAASNKPAVAHRFAAEEADTPCNLVQFVPGTETQLVTAGEGKAVKFWDIADTSRPTAVLSGFREGVNSVLFGNPAHAAANGGAGFIYAGCDDGFVYVFTSPFSGEEGAGALHDRFQVSETRVNDIVLLPGAAAASDPVAAAAGAGLGDVLLTGGDDGSVGMYLGGHSGTVAQRQALAQPLLPKPETGDDDDDDGGARDDDDDEGEGDAVPDNNRRAGGGAAAAAGAPAVSRQLCAGPDFGEQPVNHLAYANRTLYLAAADTIIALASDPVTGAVNGEPRVLHEHVDFIRGLHFGADGGATTLYSVGDDKLAVEWDLASGTARRKVTAHDDLVMAAAVAPAANGGLGLLATGSEDSSVRLWRLPLPGSA